MKFALIGLVAILLIAAAVLVVVLSPDPRYCQTCGHLPQTHATMEAKCLQILSRLPNVAGVVMTAGICPCPEWQEGHRKTKWGWNTW